MLRNHRAALALCAALAVLALAVGSVRSARAATGSGYRGLGATVGAFYAQNTQGAGMPPLGLIYFNVDASKRGRVTAFHIVINARPAFSPRERIAVLGGINLPLDATETNLNSDHCLVWHSEKLGKLIGMAYAAATTGSDNTTAHMRAESKPHC